MSTIEKHDMTQGKILLPLVSFTIPLVLGNLFQLTYNAADSVIVGKYVGEQALAAVGTSTPIMNIAILLISGMCMGASVLMSSQYGAKDYDTLSKQISTTMLAGCGFSVVFSLLMLLLATPVLRLIRVPETAIPEAAVYLRIIFLGLIFTFIYNFLANTMRALGDSKTPLYFLLFSAALNIVLDLVLIIVFHLGAAGAAYATVIAQGVSALLCLIYIIKKVPILKLDRWDFKLDGHLVRQQLAIGFPMALQYSITAIGAMMVQAALNVLGSVHVAAFTAANKIEQVVTQVYVALGTTMATYCAQNMGAGKVKRISRGFRATTIMGSMYSVVFGVLVFYFGNMLTGLFVSENLDQIVGLVDVYMKCVALFFVPLNVVNVYRNGIQGMGYGFLPMTAGIAELAGRGLTAVVASHYKSYLGICLASPVAWIFASALLLVMYFGIMNKYKKAGNFRE